MKPNNNTLYGILTGKKVLVNIQVTSYGRMVSSQQSGQTLCSWWMMPKDTFCASTHDIYVAVKQFWEGKFY